MSKEIINSLILRFLRTTGTAGTAGPRCAAHESFGEGGPLYFQTRRLHPGADQWQARVFSSCHQCHG